MRSYALAENPNPNAGRAGAAICLAVSIVLQQLTKGFEALYDYDILIYMIHNLRELS